jgi:Transposase DDE domain group 1
LIAKFRGDLSVRQVSFDFAMGCPVSGAFDGGLVSVNGGVPLLREVDERLGLTKAICSVLPDHRKMPERAIHSKESLIRQSIYQRAAGYEDTNDADVLRADPMFMLVCGRKPGQLELASQESLCRFENAVTKAVNEVLEKLLLEIYIKKHRTAPKQIELDMDSTCDPVHGNQEGSIYNGYYKESCYTPLLMYAGGGFPLGARLRVGNAGRAEAALPMLKRTIPRLRKEWPEVAILFRGDNGFAAPDIYNYLDDKKVDYVICVANNHALKCKPEIKAAIEEAREEYTALFGEPKGLTKKEWRQRQERIRFSTKKEGRQQELFELEQRKVRKYAEFKYQARSWPTERRMICRIEFTEEGASLIFIVTSIKTGSAKWLYEEKYCRRGQCENWIKEMKALKCDRLSCQEFKANQFRLLLHTFAYVLVREMRELLGQHDGQISIQAVQTRLLKIGVTVISSARQVKLRWSSWHPWQSEFHKLMIRLRAG